MRTLARYPMGAAIALMSSVAAAQSTLGDLLDAGATKLSAEEFRTQIVQRAIVGPTSTGRTLEVIYVTSGTLQGMATGGFANVIQAWPVRGEWNLDDGGRICAAMQMDNGTAAPTVLPARCQYWFKLGDAYYISDSDSDRRAKVLRRTFKP